MNKPTMASSPIIITLGYGFLSFLCGMFLHSIGVSPRWQVLGGLLLGLFCVSIAAILLEVLWPHR